MIQPSPWMLLPFVGLLMLIALGPLFFSGWWGRHYGKVAICFALLLVVYYSLSLHAVPRVEAVAWDYVRFIALIASLFIVSGGIHMTVKGEATPCENVRFLFCGALLANVLGTTGASILLIRPWLRMNKYRVSAHHVVFFIFTISNVGGCLTPIGDPPLYLGYLKGIPFWWIATHCWPIWAVGVGVLLAMFYVVDRKNYLKAPRDVRERLAEPPDQFVFDGLLNLVFLGVILCAAFVEHPPFLREVIMLTAAAASYFATPKRVHQANNFSFTPIKEVALLFLGIFATMMPALDWLESHAASFGQLTPPFYYLASGTLSSVLDNAPTYLTFLSAFLGNVGKSPVLDQVQFVLQHGPSALDALGGATLREVQNTLAVLHQYFSAELATGKIELEQIRIAYALGNLTLSKFIIAISVGSVFFGANTYIGNGPNFMVKSIADHHKVHTPTFIGYITNYTFPFMVTMLLIVWWIFFCN